MACSPAKLAANRRNAALSTGPRDTALTRFNALKHGLTASGMALPGEDPDEVQRQVDAILRRLDPRDAVEELIARRFVVASFRLRRGERFEHAMQATRVDHAVSIHDEEQAAIVNDLVGTIHRDPFDISRRLRALPVGIQCLGQNLLALAARLAEGAEVPWQMGDAGTLLDIMGVANGEPGFKRILYLGEAAVGFFGNVPAGVWSGLGDAEKVEVARVELKAIIDAEFARLKAAKEGLNHEVFARDRAGSEDRALFDASKEAELARKYEAAAERSFYRALRELKEWRKMGIEEAEPEPVAAAVPEPPVEPPASRRGTLASFFQKHNTASQAAEPRPEFGPEGEKVAPEGAPGVVSKPIPPDRE